MATLTGQSIASSYEQLLHVDTNGGGNTTTLVPIKDGDNGTLFAAQLSTTTLCIDNPTTSSASQGGILRLQCDDGAVMASGHRLGVIEFGGAEDTSSTITTGARIEALADATWSASENGADMVFYTTDGNASQSEVMRLTADAGTLFSNTVTTGVDDTGVDVRIYSATASEGLLYDASEDELGLLLTTKLKFHDIGGGEEIYASANGHLEINAGTTLDITAPTVDINASTAVTVDTPAVTVTDTTASSSTEGGFLRLASNDGAVMASGHRLGVIEFAGAEDTGNTMTVGARIEALTDATWSASENGADLLFYTTDGNASQTEAMRITAEGYIGIGTSTPYANLTVQGVTGGSAVMYLLNYDSDTSGENGAIRFGNRGVDGETASITSNADGATDAGNLNFNTEATGGAIATRMTIDSNSRISLSNNDNNSYNTVLGKLAFNAGSDNASDYNTIIGEDAAGTGTVSGASYNTAVGYKALEDITSGDANVVLGMYAGSSLTTGTGNIAIGSYDGTTAGPMRLSTVASNCIAMGTGALAAVATADADGTIAIGYNAGNDITAGQYNTILGYNAGKTISLGDSNIVIGYEAMDASYIDDTQDALTVNNVFIGQNSGGGAWATAASHNNTAIGDNTMFGAMNGATYNTVIGSGAGGAITQGDNNIMIGYLAGDAITSQSENVLIGSNAGGALTAASTTFVGVSAGKLMVAGAENTSFGYETLATDTDGNYNVAMGFKSLKNLTGSEKNVAIGWSAMANMDDTADNLGNCVAIGYAAFKGSDANTTLASGGTVAIGSTALTALTTGAANTAVGYAAGVAITTGGYNTSVGYQCLDGTDDGATNTAVGYSALSGNCGDSNVAIGVQALEATTGGSNVSIGYQSSQSLAAGTGNVAVGGDALRAAGASETNNVAIGNQAMRVMDEGTNAHVNNNIAIGNTALYGADIGTATLNVFDNIAIGNAALYSTAANAQTGTVAIGSSALTALTSGAGNTAIGYQAGTGLTAGAGNTILGYQALDAATTQTDECTAIGKNAMGGAISSADLTGVVAVGYNAASSAISATADYLVAIGHSAGYANTSGAKNTAIGYNTLLANQTGGYNTAVGATALDACTGGENTAVGWDAGGAIIGGTNNSCFGSNSGDVITTGTYNTCIGDGTDPGANDGTNQTVIGSGATGVGDNYAVIGDAATTRVYAADDVGATLYAGSATVQTSDARIKEDIKDSSLGLGFINQLRAVEYKKRQPADYDESLKKEMNWYKNDRKPRVLDELDKNKCRTGFIAQEVGEILSNMSYDNNNDIVEIDESNTQQMIAYSKLVPPLVKAIQELSAQVEELKNK